jgi:hypothetical protein
MRPRVLADATVTKLYTMPGHWAVDVTGKAPHAWTKSYTIQAAHEADAAFQGIDRFVAEVERLRAELN